MNNILWLTKIYFKETLNAMFAKVNKGKTKHKNLGLFLVIALFLFIALNMGVTFFGYAVALKAVNMQKYVLYYGMIYFNMLIIALLSYQTQDMFFKTKDFNLLASLPIKNVQIIISKFLVLLLFAYLFEFAILIPALIVYYMFVPFAFLGLVYFLVLALLLPMFGLFFGSLAILIINLISSRAVKKDKVNMFLILLFMLIVIAFFVYINYAGINQIILSGGIPNVLNYLMPNNTMMFQAVNNLNLGSALIFILMNVVLAAASVLLLSFVYLKINQNFASKHKAVKSKKSFQKKSVLSRLVSIELKNFFDKPIYVFNAGFGMLLIAIVAIGLPIYFFINKQQIFSDPSFAMILNREMFLFIYCFGSMFMILMSSTTNSSISLEANSIYFKKSLPISFEKIAASKVLVNLLIGLPILLLFCTMLPIMIIIQLSIVEILICFIVPIVAMIFISIFGLMVNLWFPKLNWTNVTMVVKNSTASLISVLGGTLIVILGVAVYFTLAIPSIYLVLGALVSFLLLSVLFGYLVLTKGKEIYKKL